MRLFKSKVYTRFSSDELDLNRFIVLIESDVMFQRKCDSFSDVLDAYNEVTPSVKLWTPTNFAPIINKAVEIVKETNRVKSRISLLLS